MLLFPGRFRRRMSIATLIALSLAMLAGARWLIGASWSGNPHWAEQRPLHEGACRFVAMETGQRLVIEQQAFSAEGASSNATPIRRPVRLLGVEFESGANPQGKPWSQVAAEFIERQSEGKTWQLKFDKRRVDRSQCYLAYVYVDEVLLNEQLLDEGLARASEYPGDSASIAKRLRSAEARARAAKRGLWSGGNL